MIIVEEKYEVVYSLYKAEGIDVFLPTAYICNLDRNNRPAYIQALALPENIGSYGIMYKDTIHESLIELVNELRLSELEKSFNKNKNKPEKLISLFADLKVQKVIQGFIDKRMIKFLELVRDNNYLICHNLSRGTKANDLLLGFYSEQIRPLLLFSKTQTGIRYYLKLKIGEKLIRPMQHEVLLLTNSPGIICLDKIIMWLNDINSSKLKPFLTDESVFIPAKLVKSFFTQFIIDVMGKVDIESEGFEIKKSSTITGQTLIFIFDIFENKWVIDIRFEYDGFSFMASDSNRRKTKINFDNEDQIIVSECNRNHAGEEAICSVIKNIGFKKMYNNRFWYDEQKFSVLETIAEHIESLKVVFEIQYPESDGKLISLLPLKILPDFVLINDWFDLHGIVKIGDNSYPIRLLFNNIRKEDPYLKLKDGTFALIPEEIMTKYSHIVKFGLEVNEQWRLSKVHFTILESTISNVKNTPPFLITEDDFDYQTPISLLAELRPYQIQGVKWLINHRKNNMGACLSDDMGLGKTLQTIAALLDAKANKKYNEEKKIPFQMDLFGELQTTGRNALGALIILPASLVFNWYSEIRKYAPSLQVVQYTGIKRKRLESTLFAFDVILTTYQTLVVDAHILKPIHFHYIVLDESQQIRNKNSKTFNAVHQLQADHRLSLSGTPIENSLADLWAQMEFINPSILGSFSFFKEHFQIPIEKYNDEKAIGELKILVGPFILRRTKDQVAKDLPDLIENIHYTEMSDLQAKYYEKEKSAARNHIAGLDKNNKEFRFHILSSLMKLRQIANHPAIVKPDFKEESGKFEDVKDNILTITKAGNKVLVFSFFLSHLNLYADWMQGQGIDYLMLTGKIPASEKEKAVNSFQNDNKKLVFLLSIKAGGTGLNLTAADYVIILDPWWNPFVEKQAVARAHRIGRQKNVIVTRFISKDTIEEKILRLQDKKKILSDNIIEENDWSALADDELIDLLD